MADIWLVEFRPHGSPACFRLLADALPPGADDLLVSLATLPGGCMTPVTSLHTHDYHAAGATQEYIDRVVTDTRKQLKTLNWKEALPTGYKFHRIDV